MENNDDEAIVFNGTNFGPQIRNYVFKLGIIVGALIISATLEDKASRALQFYGIMSSRLKKVVTL